MWYINYIIQDFFVDNGKILCAREFILKHYSDAIMGTMASQVTSLTIVYSTVYSGADQRKYQSSASLAFVRGIHRGPVNSPCKWPVTRKMFPLDDVNMRCVNITNRNETQWRVNTLKQRQDGRYFADDVLKCIFLNENVLISIKISLKLVPKGPINNIPALVQIMAWGGPGDKPLSEPMLVFVPSLGLNAQCVNCVQKLWILFLTIIKLGTNSGYMCISHVKKLRRL